MSMLLEGKPQLTYRDFSQLANDLTTSSLYVISINSDMQHYPVAAIDLPESIAKLRKEIKGSKQSEDAILDRYNGTLLHYNVHFVKDGSGILYLVIVDNKAEAGDRDGKSPSIWKNNYFIGGLVAAVMLVSYLLW
ncbi:hypothetical protein [Paenibacillus sp. OV219]|uniref:hypothetical protein n=1 Tax=Paenibacillus sp. OV219 TaxID=1884377 RepID=UPI0011600EB3|nr:hypothetical protein [Paenibacillus sp. OV219]